MKLKELLKDVILEQMYGYDENFEIEYLCTHSKKICKNSLFFALNGTNANGQNYALEALKNGAKVIVTENNVKNNFINKIDFKVHKNASNLVPEKACVIVVKNARVAMSKICANFYENLHKNLKIISVVGTNGKTSTTHILAKILSQSGKSVGVIGTNQISYNGKTFENDMTTPDPIELHKIFYDMAKNNVEYVVMEVSAHAIYFDKLYGVKSECTIFTNFSQDHLDFFKTMENYKNTKLKFFDKEFTKSCVVNVDDLVGREILSKANIPSVTYGIKNPSDVFAVNVSMNLNGSQFVVNSFDDVYEIKSNLTCLFNVYNILSCIACASVLGVSKTHIKKAIKNLDNIAGRFNILDFKQNFNVVVDYAHTPESLRNLLVNVKGLTKSKIITVFGCPGNRDEKKREIMGKIAGELSDYCIITTDNPQFENSYRIIRQIEYGVSKTNCPYKLLDDREEAISLALSLAQPKNTVLIVGKGIENYQNINGEHVPFADYECVKKQLLIAKKIKLLNKFLY